MSDKVKATMQYTRRAFLKYTGAGIVLPTVLGMLPNVVGGRAYAQSEKDKWADLTAKYGSPSGKFGKIGEPVTLTVGYQPYCTAFWTSTINKRSRIWLKHLPKGSNIVWFRALSGPVINSNMLTGKSQFGYMAETPALYAGDNVACDLVAVTGYDLGEVGSLCVRNDLLKAGKVKSPKDLEGQSVGVAFGSFSHRQVLTWAEQSQVKLNLLDQSIEKQKTDLKNQQIWAGALWEPYPQLLEQREVATRWVTGQDLACTCKKYFPQAGDHTFRAVGATLAIHDWLRERPDIMVAYLKSEEECRDLLVHNPDLAAYHVWSDVPGIPAAVIRATLDMMVWDGRITPAIKQHLKGCAKLWQQQGFLKQPRSADVDKYIDEWANESYLRYTIREMQSQGVWTSEALPGFPKEMRPDQLTRHSWKTYETIQLKEQAWQPTAT